MSKPAYYTLADMSVSITDRRLLTVPEARRYLGGISHEYIYVLMRRGDITPTRLGRRTMLDLHELDRFIDVCTARGGDPDAAA